MTCRVVCISRASGARGEDVGRIVAERLGYRYVDEEIVVRAAEVGGLDPELVADAEQRRSLLRRLVEAMGRSSEVHHSPLGPMPDTDEHIRLIRDVVREVAEGGEAVIVAHAASHALAGQDGVLRVLVTASPEARASRIVEEGDAEAERAAAAVRDNDRARADYLRRFYGVESEQPAQYDLVVNTGTLGPERAAELILRAAG